MSTENFEKSLKDWKLPPSSASDVFVQSSSACFFPGHRVQTVEKAIPLHEGIASFPLISKYRKIAHQICNGNHFIRVGMIQVALKPSKLGSDTHATISLRDNRMEYPHSVLSMVESSNLRDGPIYFSYHPTYCVPLTDSCDTFTIVVDTLGNEGITLMYRFHYAVVQVPFLVNYSRRFRVDESGKTTVDLTYIAEGNRVESKTISWGGIGDEVAKKKVGKKMEVKVIDVSG